MHKKFHERINRKPVFCRASDLIDFAAKRMIEKSVSSILVLDDFESIVGILTERDILRKLATLDVDRKLARPIRTIMSPKVHCVQLNNMMIEIVKLHQSKGIRHFPILKNGSSLEKANIYGIVTVTDLARQFLDNLGPLFSQT